MDYRYAEIADIPTLAGAEESFMGDVGEREIPARAALEERWRERLEGDYRAVLFEEDGRAVAYTLYAPSTVGVVVEQFFVWPDVRRQGVGREMFELLREEIWAPTVRVAIHVAHKNAVGRAFLAAVGFAEARVLMELPRPAEAEHTADES